MQSSLFRIYDVIHGRWSRSTFPPQSRTPTFRGPRDPMTSPNCLLNTAATATAAEGSTTSFILSQTSVGKGLTLGECFYLELTILVVEMISSSVTVTTPLKLAFNTGHTMSPTLILCQIHTHTLSLSLSHTHTHTHTRTLANLRASATVTGGAVFTILSPAANDRAMSSAFFGSAATTFIAGLIPCACVCVCVWVCVCLRA